MCALLAAALVSGVAGAAAESQPSSGALRLSTDAFEPGGPMSWRYTCYNALEPSPPVAWSGVAPDAGALALVFDSPDRPAGIGIHWLMFNLPVDSAGLPESVPRTETLANGALQGRNDLGKIGFGAPCPPVLTTYTYRLTLYVLDQPLDAPAGVSGDALQQGMAGHVLDSAQISGLYLRPAWPWG